MRGVVYRYIEDGYAPDFVRGRVLVSTLARYSAMELFGSDTARGDAGEGTRDRRLPFASIGEKATQRDIDALARVSIHLGENAKYIQIIGGNTRTLPPPMLVLCMSTEWSVGLGLRFQCRSAIEIFNPNEFLRRLSGALDMHYFFGRCTRVQYDNSRVFHAYDERPLGHEWLHKPKRYSAESEVRAFWFPRNATVPVQTQVVDCGDLSDVCRVRRLW